MPPVFLSSLTIVPLASVACHCYNGASGALAEQLRSGLQNRVDGCDSRTCLHEIVSMFEAISVLVDQGAQEMLE
jgi:hypothetical protein